MYAGNNTRPPTKDAIYFLFEFMLITSKSWVYFMF